MTDQKDSVPDDSEQPPDDVRDGKVEDDPSIDHHATEKENPA